MMRVIFDMLFYENTKQITRVPLLSVSYMLAGGTMGDKYFHCLEWVPMSSACKSVTACPNCPPDVQMILMAWNVVLMFSEHIRPERDGSPVRAQAATGGQVL